MDRSTIVSCPKNTWTLVSNGSEKVDIMPLINSPRYLIQYVNNGEPAPSDLSKAAPIFTKSDIFSIDVNRIVDVYIYSKRKDGSVLVYNNTSVHQNTSSFQRPLSSNGLPSGNINIGVDGSVTPQEFYIEALEGERLAVARVMISIRSATNININEYGDQSQLTNGIRPYFQAAAGLLAGQKIDLLYPLAIRRNEDWGRWCFDSVPIPIGPTQNTQTWQARWTLTKYGNPFGIVLEEGDRIGVIVSDDISSLTEHTIVGEGIQLGITNSIWVNIIP